MLSVWFSDSGPPRPQTNMAVVLYQVICFRSGLYLSTLDDGGEVEQGWMFSRFQKHFPDSRQGSD